ncbi:MAG: hypothetical protein ACOCVN_02760 [bacterium]
MKKLKTLSIFFTCLTIVSSCKKDNTQEDVYPVSKEKVNGFAQKGPFINGTSIVISELNADLSQSGKTFNTQISDNKGSFELKGINLLSQYVELKANGFYFNEITGDKSTAQLTLYALSDLTEKSSVNVNLLSHLEMSRIKYLFSAGLSFEEAKKQAQSDILKIFSINKPGIKESETLDISKEGDDNAILLAISLIMQGYRTDAELSELLANIGTDIKEDGILNSTSIGSNLINHAKLLDLSKIRQNLVNRYEELGIQVNVGDFEKYVNLFIDSTTYEFTNHIQYPENSNYGENILYPGKNNFKTFNNYSLAADLPIGTNLKVVLKGGNWYYQTMPNGPINWDVSNYDHALKIQEFTSKEGGKSCDLKIGFSIEQPQAGGDSTNWELITKDTITVEFYENNSGVPTKTKMIYITE